MDYIGDLRKLIGTRPIIMVGANVILINEKGEMLLHHRRDMDSWGLPGGAMELGESLEENARREVYEEVGLTCGKLELFNVYSGADLYHKYPDGNEVYNVTTTYLCRDYFGEMNVDMNEGRDAKFFPIDALPHNLSGPVAKSIHEYVAYASSQAGSTKKHEDTLIETERLRLRPFHESDLSLIYSINNNPECIRFNGWDSMSHAACQEVLIKWQARQAELKTSGPMCVVEKNTGEAVGMAFILPWQECEETYEIGFRLQFEKWHQGYAKELTKGFVDYAQNVLKANAIVGEVGTLNERSLNVFRKMGFVESTHPDGDDGRLFTYALNILSNS